MNTSLRPVSPPRVDVIGFAFRLPAKIRSTRDLDFFLRDPDAQPPMVRLEQSSRVTCRGSDGTWAALLDDVLAFDSDRFSISPREAVAMDPQQRLLLEIAYEALEDAAIVPEEIEGKSVGVFVGAMGSDFAELTNGTIGEYTAIGTELSFLSGRLAYSLGVRGPCSTVCTACSSALAAIHQASEAIRAGECDLAIAGGVNLIFSDYGNNAALQVGTLSAGAVCRPFDTKADGYVRGEGIGLVILRGTNTCKIGGQPRMAILGSAMMHNGLSPGITVPNRDMQVQLLSRALSHSGLTAADIGYFEAHAAGTTLGDSIEVDAIAKVYGQGRSTPLPVGSVKGHFGHLEAAAGIAAIAKVLCTFENKHIYPTRNLSQLQASCIREHLTFPSASLRSAWDASQPSVASISSYGLSGVGVNLVVSAPAEIPAPVFGAADRDRSHILTISAHKKDLVGQYAKILAAELERDSGSLRNFAHTLQSARKGDRFRAAVACQDRGDAVVKLTGPLNVTDSANSSGAVAFLFPGMGEQYAGMGFKLYQDDTDFRLLLDKKLAFLSTLTGKDLQAVMFDQESAARESDPFAALRRGREKSDRPALIKTTDFGHVVLFAFETALAELLMARGLTPSFVLGYSLGEYSAAVAAGIMDFEAAGRIVAGRAKLIGGCAPGAMLTCLIPRGRAETYVRDSLCIAAELAADVVVISGSVDDISAAKARMDQDDVVYRQASVGHAFHNAMLDRIRPGLMRLLENERLSAPQIPLISNLTGTWITDEEAVSADYWCQHSLQTVRFHESLSMLVSHEPFCVEVGPGGALTSFALQTMRGRKGRTWTMVQPETDTSMVERNLDELIAAAWEFGASINWPAGVADARLRLPPVPMEKRQFSIPGSKAGEPRRTSNLAGSYIHVSQWKGWMPVVEELRDPICVLVGEQTPDAGVLPKTLGPGRDLRIVTTLARAGIGATAQDATRPVLVVFDLTRRFSDQNTVTGLREFLQQLGKIVEELAQLSARHRVKVAFVTAGALSVLPHDRCDPVSAAVAAGVRCAKFELPGVGVLHIDLEFGVTAHNRAWEVFNAAAGESPETASIAIRKGRAWVSVLSSIPTGPAWNGPKNGAVFVITGGTGGIGLFLCQKLVESSAACTVYLLSSRSIEDEIAKLEKVRHLQRMAADRGAHVVYERCDICSCTEVEALCGALASRHGTISALFHLAGRPASGLIGRAASESIHAVLAPKIAGVKNIEMLSIRLNPQDVVLFSSTIGLSGGIGESDYAAANAYMDAFALNKNQESVCRWLSVNWGPWEWDAWTSSARRNELSAIRQRAGLTMEEGWKQLCFALSQGATNVTVTKENPFELAREIANSVEGTGVQGTIFPRPDLAGPFVAPANEVERTACAIWAEALGLQSIGALDGFKDLGANSLTVVRVAKKLTKHFGREIAPAKLFSVGNARDLAKLLMDDTGRVEPQAANQLAAGAARRLSFQARRAQ